MRDDPGDRYGVLQDQEKVERNLQGCWVREMDYPHHHGSSRPPGSRAALEIGCILSRR